MYCTSIADCSEGDSKGSKTSEGDAASTRIVLHMHTAIAIANTTVVIFLFIPFSPFTFWAIFLVLQLQKYTITLYQILLILYHFYVNCANSCETIYQMQGHILLHVLQVLVYIHFLNLVNINILLSDYILF